MTVWVLLLRGINVGGTGKLPMADLRSHLALLGATDVATYIQSGNAVFRGAIDPEAFQRDLAKVIADHHGHQPQTLLLPARDLTQALQAFPFRDSFERPKTAHVWFCKTPPPSADMDRITSLAAASERFAIEGALFFLDAPDGIGRSRLAAGVERALGVAATARNLNTVTKLVEMTQALDA